MTVDSKNTNKSMTPFIAICAFIILMTLILISFQKINDGAISSFSGPDYGKRTIIRLSLDTRESPDFSFPEMDFSQSKIALQFKDNSKDYYDSILNIRRMIAFGEYSKAENDIRTLYLFFPNDPELIRLLSITLARQGKSEENAYYRDQLLFLQERPESDQFIGDKR